MKDTLVNVLNILNELILNYEADSLDLSPDQIKGIRKAAMEIKKEIKSIKYFFYSKIMPIFAL